MNETWILFLATTVFLITTMIYWGLTQGTMKKVYGKIWKKWRARTFYWQDAIYVCTGITFLVLVFLKWTSILKF